MTNPDRHSPKKGAPDYRKAYGDEILAHQKTSRDLKARQDNEVNLLNRIEALDIDIIELNNRDIVHIKTECLQCSNQERTKRELKSVKIRARIWEGAFWIFAVAIGIKESIGWWIK